MAVFLVALLVMGSTYLHVSTTNYFCFPSEPLCADPLSGSDLVDEAAGSSALGSLHICVSLSLLVHDIRVFLSLVLFACLTAHLTHICIHNIE